jgi:hypothetical protein
MRFLSFEPEGLAVVDSDGMVLRHPKQPTNITIPYQRFYNFETPGFQKVWKQVLRLPGVQIPVEALDADDTENATCRTNQLQLGSSQALLSSSQGSTNIRGGRIG